LRLTYRSTDYFFVERREAHAKKSDACGKFSNELGKILLGLADGMVGHAGGVIASRLCIVSVAHECESMQGTPADSVRRGLEPSNYSVFAASHADSALTEMGTSGGALLFAPEATVCLG
jgi:serine/threonine protein phosphatase PrpC